MKSVHAVSAVSYTHLTIFIYPDRIHKHRVIINNCFNIQSESHKPIFKLSCCLLYTSEWRTIYHNILLGLEIQHTLTAAAKTHARELLKTYGLEKFADSRPSELSGGMRQRAALIRTLILEPDLLLLDEPFSALDYQTRLSVGDDIGQIIRDSGRTAVLVTHDLSEAISLADTIFILSKRPASIARIVPVTFSLDEDTPLKRRSAPEFKTYFNILWKELNQNV